jgi:hypothetical protein
MNEEEKKEKKKGVEAAPDTLEWRRNKMNLHPHHS